MTIRYVNTASTAGGDGTTNEITGVNRAFASLREAIDSLPSTLADAYTIYCEGSAADPSDLNQGVWDFTTTAANYLLITTTAANRTPGKWDSTKYRIAVTNSHGIYNDYPEHLRIDGLQIEVTVNNAGSCVGIKTTNANQNSSDVDCRVSNCIVKGIVTSGTLVGYTTSPPTGSGIDTTWNCIAIDCSQGFETVWAGAYLYNCATLDTYYGFVADAAFTVKNCLTQGAAIGFVGTFGGNSDYNCASDETAPPGAHSFANVTFSFLDIGNDDLHLSPTDAGAQDRGIGPGSDANVPTLDIDGHTRSGATCDVGPDEIYVAPIVDAPEKLRVLAGARWR